jgi:hypothetical protein
VSQDGEFTAQEWLTLQFAPFWIFSALLGSYRDFDPLEYDAFSRCLQVAASGPGRLTRDVLTSVLIDRRQLTRQYESDGRTIALGLCAVAAILTKAPTEEATMFKDMLISGVGEGVAKARGRFGQIMSEDDEKTLLLVAQFLS